jgi:hypothetical protein
VTLARAGGYAAEAYAVKRPLGRVWAYSVLSFGLYGYAWFHIQRRLLDGEMGLGRDDATLHTLGCSCRSSTSSSSSGCGAT